MMRRLESEPEHVQQVARLARDLFDQLSAEHSYGAPERLLLEGAALLHDIGWNLAPGGSGHHKESELLIREEPWKTLTSREVDLIAQIARYHRKSLPSENHPAFAALPEEDRKRVEILAGLLRVADALDRSHLQRVEQLNTNASSDEIRVQLQSVHPCDEELAAAKKKSDLAEKVFRCCWMFERL